MMRIRMSAWQFLFAAVIIYSYITTANSQRVDKRERLINRYNQKEDRLCKWTKRPDAPEVYYINMDKSADRKVHMEGHLTNVGLPYHRVRANPWKEIYVPPDVEKLWTTRWCLLNTEEKIPSKEETLRNKTSHLNNYTSIMSGLCGRGKDKFGKDKNTLKELGR